jgi:molecular chaperone GrpE
VNSDPRANGGGTDREDASSDPRVPLPLNSLEEDTSRGRPKSNYQEAEPESSRLNDELQAPTEFADPAQVVAKRPTRPDHHDIDRLECSESFTELQEPEPTEVEWFGRIVGELEGLRNLSEEYHQRAAQRESVIDHLTSEIDRLKVSERRNLLIPLLIKLCRLRNDVLKQAGSLPSDFNADRAQALLTSYADSLESMLDGQGVRPFVPEAFDVFDPRLHRRIGQEDTTVSESAGKIAQVKHSGYRDLDSDRLLVPADVCVYVATTIESACTDVPNSMSQTEPKDRSEEENDAQ